MNAPSMDLSVDEVPVASGTAEPAVRGVAHVVLPAFNEEGSLPALLGRLAEAARAERLVAWVVDDGSTDGTLATASRGAPGIEVRIVAHEVNMGLGRAVQSGLRAVLDVAEPHDLVVVMDADDTHDPALVRKLNDAISGGADIVICSRFVAGGDDSTAPAFRRALSRSAAALFRNVLGIADIHDFTSGFRAYRVELLDRAFGHWGDRLIEERGFACMVELLLKLRHCDPQIVEIPLVLQYDRKQGASKLRLRRTIGQYLKLLARDRLTPAPYRAV